jgi:hypothetical protein
VNKHKRWNCDGKPDYAYKIMLMERELSLTKSRAYDSMDRTKYRNHISDTCRNRHAKYTHCLILAKVKTDFW